VVCGLFILTLMHYPLKWRIAGLLGLCLPVVAVWTGNVRRFLLVLLTCSLPINADVNFFYREHIGGPGGLSLSVVDGLLLMLYALWMIEWVTQREPSPRLFPRATLPLLGFVGLNALSVVRAEDPSLSLFQGFHLLKGVLLYLYVANGIRDRKDLRYALGALMVGLCLESFLGFYQYSSGGRIGLKVLGESGKVVTQKLGLQSVSRVVGTFGSPNTFAFYLGMILPTSMVLLLSSIGLWKKVLSTVACGVGVATLGLTLSRGGWGGFAVSVLLAIWWMLRTGSMRKNRVYGLIGLIVFLGLLGGGLYGIVSSRLVSDDYGAAQLRIPMMRTALAIISAHPLLGIGANNYSIVMQAYDTSPQQISTWFPYPVHNLFLLVASEAGVPALMFFLTFLIALYWMGRSSIRSRDGLVAMTAIGLLSGWVGFLLHALVDYVLIGLFVVFWYTAGLMCALYRMSAAPAIPLEGERGFSV